MTDTITTSGRGVDLSARIAHSSTVVASPQAATETTIATCTLDASLTFTLGVLLVAFAAWTVGTSGDGVNLKLRQTGTSGTTITASGLITSTATNLDGRSIIGFDTSPAAGQVYVLTMTVHSGAAASTVSAVQLIALAI